MESIHYVLLPLLSHLVQSHRLDRSDSSNTNNTTRKSYPILYKAHQVKTTVRNPRPIPYQSCHSISSLFRLPRPRPHRHRRLAALTKEQLRLRLQLILDRVRVPCAEKEREKKVSVRSIKHFHTHTHKQQIHSKKNLRPKAHIAFLSPPPTKKKKKKRSKLTPQNLPHPPFPHTEPIPGDRGRDASLQHKKAHVHLIAVFRLFRRARRQLDDAGPEERHAEEFRISESRVLDFAAGDGGGGVGDI